MSGRRSPQNILPGSIGPGSGLVGLAVTIALALVPGPALTGAETVLVASGQSMVYRANSSDPGIGTAWMQESFNSSAWLSGIYGVGSEARRCPPVTSNRPTGSGRSPAAGAIESSESSGTADRVCQ